VIGLLGFSSHQVNYGINTGKKEMVLTLCILFRLPTISESTRNTFWVMATSAAIEFAEEKI